MKKICLFLCMMFMIILTTGCSMSEVNVDIKNVQETEISFSVADDMFSTNTINKLKQNDFTVSKEGEELKVSTIVSNIKLSENVNKKFATLLQILKENDTKVYNEIKDYSFMIESSFDGYPFGAAESVNLASANIPDDFKININGQDIVSLNKGDLASSIQVTGKDLKQTAFVSYNMLSIDELEVSIEPQKDYKSVNVFFRIASKNPVLADMPKESFSNTGFTVESQSPTSLVLSKSYENSEMFNYVFNMDLINYFGIIGKTNIDYKLNIIKELKVDMAFSESELIDNVKVKLIIPKAGTDSVSNVKDTNFSWTLDKSFKANINSTVPNYSTIIIAFISVISIVFVFMGLTIIKKRGVHIKYK